MKVWTFSLCRNERAMVQFFLRHYAQFAEKIHVWDDGSTDGTREILKAHPKVLLYDWQYDTGIDEDLFLKFAQRTYPMAVGEADWCIWIDLDEFIYDPDLIGTLRLALQQGFDVIPSNGFNMVGERLPEDDGRSQIWKLHKTGVRAPVYSKPVVFRPECDIKWSHGKHALEQCDAKVFQGKPVKLLHYRYMGFDCTKAKNRKNWERCGIKTGDKASAWSCTEEWKGEHSPEWAENAIQYGTNVVDE